jgi:hypothetical protein
MLAVAARSANNVAFGDYVRAGWALCSIAQGSKGPLYAGWNEHANAIVDAEVGDVLDGAGLLHAYSGTCAIDVDHYDAARTWLAARDIDLDALFRAPDSVEISSGRVGHGKLIYRLPEPMMSTKIIQEIDGNKVNIIDFRCAARGGKSVQDVLPGTIHPDTGRPYAWLYGDELAAHWSMLPALPEPLAAVWRSLLTRHEIPVGPPTAPGAPAGLDPLKALLAGQDPDCDRDTWLKVLAALHWETQGSADGLALAISWSSGGLKFIGPEDVETRWRSFSLSHPDPVTAASLRKAEPAAIDEFPIVTPEIIAAAAVISDSTDVDIAKQRRGELERRLIYVKNADRYYDTERRDLLANDHALLHRFGNFMGKKIKPAKMLAESSTKKSVDGMAFHPGRGPLFFEHGEEFANNYRPIPTQLLVPTDHEKDMIEWLFHRIDDTTFRTWLKQFLAHAVQRPGVKIRSCPLVWSEITGNGKSTLLKTIPTLLFGARYSKDVNVTSIEEKFNGFLLGAWHVYLAEFRAGTRADREAIADKLKPWISDDTVTVREMRTDAYTMTNRFVMTATSNKADSAPIDREDRRWGVYELTAPPMTAAETQDVVIDFLVKSERARGVLLHYFMNLSTTGFNPDTRPPETAAKLDMIAASKTSDIEAIDIAWEEHSGPFIKDVCTVAEVQDLCTRGGFKPTQHAIGRLLVKLGGVKRQIRVGAGRQRIWVMRNHSLWMMIGEADLAAYAAGEIIVDPLCT